MSTWRRLFFALSLGSTLAAHGVAQTPSGPSLQQVDVSAYPWSAIGKLNNSVGGSCTGAAIAQDEVLTAAHCIFNRRTGKFLPSSALHVLFGYTRGIYKVHALVDRYLLGPGYDPAREKETLASDWAVLTLSQPLPADMKPLRAVDQVPAAGTALMIAGYGQRRLHVMTGDEDCKLIGAAASGDVLVHNCKVSRGISGAPLLTIEDGTPVVIGLQVALGTRNGAAVGWRSPWRISKRPCPSALWIFIIAVEAISSRPISCWRHRGASLKTKSWPARCKVLLMTSTRS